MTRSTWTVSVLLAALGVAGGAALVATGSGEPARAAVEAPVLVVSVLDVQPGDVSVSVQGTGVVTPAQEVQLASRVSGPVVWTADLRPGRTVLEGETLARIDPTAFEASVADARSGVAGAREALALEDGKGRVASLEQQLIGGETSPLAQRDPQRASAKAKLVAAEAALAKAERDLADTRIRAPFDGVLVDSSVERGGYLATGSSVGRLVGSQTMWVQLPLPLAKADQLDLPGYNATEGSEAVLRLVGAEGSRAGRVVGVAGEVDAATRSIDVLVAVQEPLDPALGPVLLPGSFVEVTVAARSLPDAVRLPSAALHDGGSVWTVSREGELSREAVQLRWREGDHVVVAGLLGVSRVVLSHSGSLLEGAVAQVMP
ncbi:MAG: efflux RND transporter periplasmic adaptor subunit [Myxococcales bacterium]|nr:efflux RND transporter periplasmic adaptor subunit [Myxococcales bacterium]